MPFVPTFTPSMTPRFIPSPSFRAPSFVFNFPTPQPDIVRPTNADTYVSALINGILLRLNENSDTSIFNLETGIGGAATVGQADAILAYLNEGAADLCRTGGYTIPGTATWTNMPSGTTSIPFSTANLATGDTSVLWAATGVSWNGTPLTYCEKSRLDVQKVLITGTDPLYWYRMGAEGIGIYPAPTFSADLVVTGYMIPPLLAFTSDRPSWLVDDLVKLLAWFVCAQAAKKNMDDPVLHARFAEWEPLYLEGKNALLARLWASDPGLARALSCPAPMMAGGKK